MDKMEMILILSNMTVGEHKQMSKALRVLLAVGIDQFTALDIICRGIKDKQTRLSEERYNRGMNNLSKVK
jgi:hypothetical protein